MVLLYTWGNAHRHEDLATAPLSNDCDLGVALGVLGVVIALAVLATVALLLPLARGVHGPVGIFLGVRSGVRGSRLRARSLGDTLGCLECLGGNVGLSAVTGELAGGGATRRR